MNNCPDATYKQQSRVKSANILSQVKCITQHYYRSKTTDTSPSFNQRIVSVTKYTTFFQTKQGRIHEHVTIQYFQYASDFKTNYFFRSCQYKNLVTKQILTFNRLLTIDICVNKHKNNTAVQLKKQIKRQIKNMQFTNKHQNSSHFSQSTVLIYLNGNRLTAGMAYANLTRCFLNSFTLRPMIALR